MKQDLSSRDATLRHFDSLAECYAWLEGHINHERRLGQVRYTDENFALDQFRARLAQLGDPQGAVPAIHIAGSAGKGSTALLLETALLGAGYRVAAYTSPHFHEYRERIRLDGTPIPGEGFCAAMSLATAAAPSESDSFNTVFEYLTAAYFLAAREAKVDWSIVETGLGGRLDATNALPPGPVLWTRIGLEHTQLLGRTAEAIAGEKAAILKAGGFAVAARQESPEALEVFKSRGREVGAEVIEATEVCPLLTARYHDKGMDLTYRWLGEPMEFHLPLFGPFLADNLQGVLAMLGALVVRGLIPELPRERLQSILSAARLPGRMEQVSRSPALFADGGHCPPAARAVAETMQAHFSEESAVALVSLVADKDLPAFFEELARWPGWRELLLYKLDSPRAAEPEALAEAASPWFPNIKIFKGVNEALEFESALADKWGRIIATGSMFGVESVRRWGALHERQIAPDQGGTET